MGHMESGAYLVTRRQKWHNCSRHIPVGRGAALAYPPLYSPKQSEDSLCDSIINSPDTFTSREELGAYSGERSAKHSYTHI